MRSLVGLLLIRSDNLYFKISGVVVGLAAVAPLAWSGISYLFRGRFEPVDDLLNGAEAAPEIDLAHRPASGEVQLSARRYTALTAGAIGFLALCVLVGGLLAWRIKRESIGDYLKLSADSRTAFMRADAVLREHGLDPNSFRKGALFVDTTNPVANEYLRRRMSIAEINKIYAERVPGALWRVRYFRDSQAEEFAVTLKPDGSLHGFWHTLPEAAKGATLGKEEAVAIAEIYLREKKQIDLSGWKLVESSSDKRPNRTDHTLTWQQNVPLDPQNAGGKDAADHAYARMDLHILGNEPADYRTYIKIPDEFERKQDEQSLPRTLFNVGRFVVAVGLAIVVLIVYFTRSRKGSDLHVPWRRLVIWGLVGLAVYLFQFLLGKGIPETLADYSTAYPWKIFLAGIVVRQFIAAAFLGGILVILFGLAWHFAAQAFGEERVPMWLGMPANYYRDAFWIGLGGSGLLIGLQRLLGAASLWWPTLRRAVPSDFGTSFDALVPAGGVIGGAIYDGLLIYRSPGCCRGVYRRGTKGTLVAVTAVLRPGRGHGHELGFSGRFLEAISVAINPADGCGVWDPVGGAIQPAGVVPCDCVHGPVGGRIAANRAARRLLPEPGLYRVDSIGGTADVAAGVMAAAAGRERRCGVGSQGTGPALRASKGVGRANVSRRWGFLLTYSA